MEHLDLVIIGAGWHGLSAAKSYSQLQPSINLAVLDSNATVGGVWSNERRYSGLQTNNLVGTYEFSDFPMDPVKYGLKERKAVPGHIVQQYHHDYAVKFNVLPKIRFQTKVESAERLEGGGWLLSLSITQNSGKVVSSQIWTAKLIVATGMASAPAQPVLKGMEDFGAPLFHFKSMSSYEKELSAVKRVCVYGGTKQACDAVYLFGTRGVEVDWVIRESGHGPTWNSPPFVTPLKRQLETLPHIRLLSWFSPCIWSNSDGYSVIRSLLHSTRIGRWIVDRFWDILKADVVALNKFDEHPEMKKLKPWSEPMFTATSIGILNYETDLYDLVRNGIAKVHIADIDSLGPKTIHLSSGDTLSSDALVACTGWTAIPPVKFLPEGIDLGLPTSKVPTADHLKLIQQVDNEILTRFPRLKDQPARNPKLKPRQVVNGDKKLSSYNLYRFMVPPSTVNQRDIVFMGVQMCFFTPQVAQLQALWVTAYLSNSPHLQLPDSIDTIQYETVLHNRFGKWRYPQGFGESWPDFVFDAVPYVDMLLADLGLNRWRKNGKLAEWFTPYGPKDYKGLVEEFQALSEKINGETRKDV